MGRLSRLVRENRAFLIFLFLMFAFRSAVADWNEVPTGSMKPTILEGDRILVNKLAYDVHIPFTHISLKRLADPQRGEIVIFDSKASDKRLVKRVIGLPGDVIEMRNNVLSVNGRVLDYKSVSASDRVLVEQENLLGVRHLIKIHKNGGPLSSFRTYVIPKDRYLMLGDNRDNSADSRVIGFVPRHEIVGRAKYVVMSLNYDNYYLPRSNRFMHELE